MTLGPDYQHRYRQWQVFGFSAELRDCYRIDAQHPRFTLDIISLVITIVSYQDPSAEQGTQDSGNYHVRRLLCKLK